jgi:hypothetical protein
VKNRVSVRFVIHPESYFVFRVSFRTGAVSPTSDSQQILTDGDEGVDDDLDAGIEVTYESDDKDELIWI